MLELTGNRVIAFSVRKRAYTLTLKPISTEMWLKYFGDIVSTEQRNEQGEVESSFDVDGAAIALLESAIVDCSGYKLPDEKKQAGGWQSALPIAHRKAAADMLTATSIDTLPDDDPLAATPFGTTAVALQSLWTADDKGNMQVITGLRHVFNEPTAEQQMRYSRANSRSVVDGRMGTTRYLGGQDVMVGLYDELVTNVFGYSNNALALDGAGKPEIASAMDACHKVVAIRALFRPVEIE